MTRFAVDSDQVTAASAGVMTTSGAISTEVAAMTRQLTDLQTSWQGGAASSFAAVAERWRATQEQVRTGLEEIAAALAAAGRSYEGTEADAVRMFSR